MWIGFQDLDWSGFDQFEFDWNWIWIEVKWDWIDTKNWIGFFGFFQPLGRNIAIRIFHLIALLFNLIQAQQYTNIQLN